MNYEKMWWTLRHKVEASSADRKYLLQLEDIEIIESNSSRVPFNYEGMWFHLRHRCQDDRFSWLRRQMKLVEKEEMEREKPAESPAKDSMREALESYQSFLKVLKDADEEQGRPTENVQKALGEITGLMEKIGGPATGFSIFGTQRPQPEVRPSDMSLAMEAWNLLDVNVETDENAFQVLSKPGTQVNYRTYREQGLSVQDAFRETVMDLAGVPKDEREGGVKG